MTVERLINWLKSCKPESEVLLLDQNTNDQFYILAIASDPDEVSLMFNSSGE